MIGFTLSYYLLFTKQKKEDIFSLLAKSKILSSNIKIDYKNIKGVNNYEI